jgi:hypothetical protein
MATASDARRNRSLPANRQREPCSMLMRDRCFQAPAKTHSNHN